MTPQKHSLFGLFRLDPENQCLWRGRRRVTLKPKAFAVLRYLVEHSGRLVSKSELLDAVWPDVSVSEGILKFCVREIRAALGDDAQAPRFIETLHRRGYRFVAPVTTTQPVVSSQLSVVSKRAVRTGSQLATDNWQLTTSVVGREAELAQLYDWLDKAFHGERQIVFVTGEAGIGKTTLVEAFLESLASERVQSPRSKVQGLSLSPIPNPHPLTPSLWIGRGQCIEHYGAGEAYMPVLEALGRLCREPEGRRFIELLGQHAPTWLVQMPALLSPPKLEALQRQMAGATRERMLREMAEALETLTGAGAMRQPPLLVLMLEDLQWSDHSTLELIATLARRREKARLLVIGTSRPVETLETEHPLRAVMQELQLHQQCKELQLELLTEAAVENYLTVRFPRGATGLSSLQPLARTVHQRTEGNPLFMVNVVDYLIARGVLAEQRGHWGVRPAEEQFKVPENLQQMIVKQSERLSPEEQRVLEVASVAGVEFSAAAVAAAVETEISEVEEKCEGLARRAQFLRASGESEWPDGTVAARYRFLHALYQEVLYGRVTAGRRQRLHQRIGEREETAYGTQAKELATELAMHFERGRDYQRAVQYLQQAGENAQRRSAHREAINHLTKGLELLQILPDTPQRSQHELVLQTTLGPSLISTKGYGVPEVERAYTRARELCRQVGETPQLFPMLLGLLIFYTVRAEYQTARELGERCLSLAQRVQDPALITATQSVLPIILLFLGEFAVARAHA
ncbi:MAG: AAA family ATPase [Deltaproteobacteria bacterium]|nr:AAA family ATPase [Deltaproteobacteria bacterium]